MQNINIIIVGGLHHNMLGVVRALGINKLYSNVIVTNKDKYSYVSKSKYVKKSIVISENEEQIISCIYSFKNDKCRNIIIPTSDFAAYVLDKNYDRLSKEFLLPSINKSQNGIIKLMDKIEQSKLAEKYGIKHAKSVKIDFSKKINDDIYQLGYPCILKPEISAKGSKSDISICNNKKELIKSLEFFKNNGYQNAILQEYIKFEKEYGLIGCIHNGNTIIPGMIEKHRIYPQKKGNVSFGCIKKLIKHKDIEQILSVLKKINYSGMFDIEVFKCEKCFYLNEYNFRNSGNSFVYAYEKVYIPYLWVKMILNQEIDNEKKSISREYYFKDEILEIKQLTHHNIGLFTFLKAAIKSKSRFIINFADFKPTFFKFYYAIKRKIFK